MVKNNEKSQLTFDFDSGEVLSLEEKAAKEKEAAEKLAQEKAAKEKKAEELKKARETLKKNIEDTIAYLEGKYNSNEKESVDESTEDDENGDEDMEDETDE